MNRHEQIQAVAPRWRVVTTMCLTWGPLLVFGIVGALDSRGYVESTMIAIAAACAAAICGVIQTWLRLRLRWALLSDSDKLLRYGLYFDKVDWSCMPAFVGFVAALVAFEHRPFVTCAVLVLAIASASAATSLNAIWKSQWGKDVSVVPLAGCAAAAVAMFGTSPGSIVFVAIMSPGLNALRAIRRGYGFYWEFLPLISWGLLGLAGQWVSDELNLPAARSLPVPFSSTHFQPELLLSSEACWPARWRSSPFSLLCLNDCLACLSKRGSSKPEI